MDPPAGRVNRVNARLRPPRVGGFPDGAIARGIDLLCREVPTPSEAGDVEALIWYWRFEAVHPFNG